MDQTWCNVPCLFYATFNNKIVVHYNVRLKEIGTSNLFDTMQQCCSATGIECPGKGNVAVLLVSSMSLCVCVCVCVQEVVLSTMHVVQKCVKKSDNLLTAFQRVPYY